MKCLTSASCLRWLLLAAVFELLLSPTTGRGGESPVPQPLSARDLQCMSPDELEQVFAHGQTGACPVGLARGTILVRVDGKLPRLRAKMSGMVWKGKYFYPDGHMVNQWAGFRAIATDTTTGPSWYDGKPCLILEYAPGTAVFGNARDEMREVAPGVFLCRFYERCPCRTLQGYFVLELAECKTH